MRRLRFGNLLVDDENVLICALQTEWDEEDEIVFCDGCNVSVHMSCYGIDALPTNEWLCQACTLCYGKSLKCELCPLRGGAMKCTKTGAHWAHVVCALWMPEVRFDDVDRREPVSHIEDIPPGRWQFKYATEGYRDC